MIVQIGIGVARAPSGIKEPVKAITPKARLTSKQDPYAGIGPDAAIPSKRCSQWRGRGSAGFKRSIRQVMDTPKLELKDDLLRGARAIADVLGCSPRTVYHLAEHGSVPIWNEPGMGLVARRSALERYFREREREALARSRQ